jgi:rare lipoprotein A (peptidoglycan hydrolase)
MSTRAIRVFPGVLFSVLLAGSVLATPSPASADTPPRKLLSQEHRRPATGARAHKATKSAVAKSAVGKPVVGKSTTVAARRRAPTAAVSSTAFVDDGFSYTEDADGRVGWKQTGIASWYGGSRWQGQHTSSGSRYDQDALTAAHATLPLGSHVRVRLANSDRSVVVTITDRPGTRTRIIDLSRAAARALGILTQGVAVVTLSPI